MIVYPQYLVEPPYIEWEPSGFSVGNISKFLHPDAD